VQLAFSPYAHAQPIYHLALFWIAGLLLGSTVAGDLRMADRLGLLALPLAVLAIIEFATNSPNLWSDVVGANGFDTVATAGGSLRASSTFGHPLVAGTALIVMGFIVLIRPGRKRTVLFSLIVAGAVVTVSRSALVGLAAGLLVYFVSGHRQRSQVIAAAATTAVIGGLMITLIPALDTSVNSRILGATTQTQRIRLNSLQSVTDSVSQGSPELILGRGLEGSLTYLAQTGGNIGFGVYDNQYVTSLYDDGLAILLIVAGLIIAGIIRARPGARSLAPLAASAATMFFFEGLYWPITGLLFWMTVGLATSPGATSLADNG
jgi:hypothetical protein